MPVNAIKLRNRVMLFTEPVVTSKTVAIGFWFSVGSRLERDGEHGITHFTEHLLFKGTRTRSARDIACAFDRIGGYVNAFTERENVCVYCTIPGGTESVETALSVLCDMCNNSVFPEDEIERERAVVKSEIASVEDDPEESAMDRVSECVWPGQSLSTSITGSSEDVDSITREQLLDWYDKYFVNGNLCVFAAGMVDSDFIAEKLETLSLKSDVPIEFSEQGFGKLPVWKNGFSFIKAGFNQTQVFELFPLAMPVSEKDYYTAAVFNAIAGDSMSSRLFDSMRERSGLCYTVYSFFTFYADVAAWCAYASCDNDKAVSVASLFIDEIEKISRSGVSDAELEAAKMHLCGEEILGSEDMEFRMKRMQRNYSMGFNLNDTSRILECIRSVTKNDIIEFIEKLFDFNKMAFVVYGKSLSMKSKRNILCRKK